MGKFDLVTKAVLEPWAPIFRLLLRYRLNFRLLLRCRLSWWKESGPFLQMIVHEEPTDSTIGKNLFSG